MRDIDELAIKINQTARNKGFWDKERNFGEMLMLATSELAEALEEHRSSRPTIWFLHHDTCELRHQVSQGFFAASDARLSGEGENGCTCVPKPEGVLVEIADCIIRCFDTGQNEANKTPFSLGDVIEIKMRYNETREKMHGKLY